MAKVRVQAHGSKSEKGSDGKAVPKYNGALDVLKKVYRSDGLIGWYRVSLSDRKHVQQT
jgi:Mitochondrial carrier protein